jgi:hypothetical protein
MAQDVVCRGDVKKELRRAAIEDGSFKKVYAAWFE